jgi:hypothetical protein
MDDEDCGKRYLCELVAAADNLQPEEQGTLSFFQVDVIVRLFR